MTHEQIIKNYAHDYRGMAMDESHLEQMLTNLLEEIDQAARDDHNQGEADQVEREEGYASTKDAEESGCEIERD